MSGRVIAIGVQWVQLLRARRGDDFTFVGTP